MNDELFNELLNSVKEGASILKGNQDATRAFEVTPQSIKETRQRYNLTQEEFAQLLDVSPRTLQNWEQGRREPEGPAKVLLKVAAVHPESILDTVKIKAILK